ncbi:MAG: Uma2 family endonuclease, partial [Egibacteraceae bacterium]
MAAMVRSGLTYEDLLAYPEENWPKRELFDGELVVSPSPVARHQSVLIRFGAALLPWAEANGASVMAGFDLEISQRTHTYICPDLIVIFADRIDLVGDRPGKAPPDVVVEISSPSTRRRDLIRKRAYYEQFG